MCNEFNFFLFWKWASIIDVHIISCPILVLVISYVKMKNSLLIVNHLLMYHSLLSIAYAPLWIKASIKCRNVISGRP